MLDDVLEQALHRLDRRLGQVCDAEEARARELMGAGGTGWTAVRHMTRAPAGSLAFDAAIDEEPIVPEGAHAFARAGTAFGLSAIEVDVLLVLLAPHLEGRYRSLYAVIQDDLDQRHPTERLVLSVLGRSPARWKLLSASLAESGRLVGTGLVREVEGRSGPLGRPLGLPPEVRGALLGHPLPPLVGGVPLSADPPTADGPFPHGLCVLHGGGEFEDPLRELAAGREILRTARCDDPAVALQGALATWRLAALRGALAAIDLTGLDDVTTRKVGETLVHRVEAYGGALVLCTAHPLPHSVPQHEVPRPTFVERRTAWVDAVRTRGGSLTEEEAVRLASAYRFGASRIRQVVASAEGTGEEALVGQAIRLLGQRIPNGRPVVPRATIDDIVLRDTTRAALERLVYYVRNRDRVGEARGLERRFRLQRGPIVLFSGRSGTGKTLAAEIIAGSLGRPMHVVDLARLVSKYIGETEKNIDEVLTAGERSGAVLFFDEADGLFSTRTDVNTSNDRFANLEVGYLLQRIEHHDGLVILATNLRQSIDEAFLRRFHSRIEFPLPGPEERHRIWELLVPEGVPRAEGVDLRAVAQAHRLSGGDIRNAALKAIFLAEHDGVPLHQDHLERAVALELLEMGRLSRREPDAPADRGQLLKQVNETLERTVERHLQHTFFKEVFVVHGEPTKETLAGKRPAVSFALYRIESARQGGMRLGYVVSTWSTRAEDGHELLGAVHEALTGYAPATLAGRRVAVRVQDSHDFDLLHRFWSSHGHPVRASVVLDVEVS